MLIKILLIFFVFLIGVYFLIEANHARTQAWKKILFTLLIAFMIIAIISPNITNNIAHTLGVGRGADLLLYVIAVAFVFQIINSFMKFKEYEHRLNKLARHIAISETQEQEGLKSTKNT
jgi:hypothetical protein